ncbi:MAG: Tol biopolymer transport system component [Marivirga sp.]|jgi:Tol biopolymer transport system component
MIRKIFSISVYTICLIGLCDLSPEKISAQDFGEQFGRNSIQYRFFNWKYYSTPHFEIYYYPGGQKLANELTVSLEEQHETITDILGYAPYAKTKIFLYNNNLELNQSNVGLGEANFTIAGQTNFLKNQIQIAFEGSVSDFNKKLKFLIAESYVNDMLFGGLISEVFASSYLFTIPDWFTEGIAAYIAYGWDGKMDDFVREFLSKENVNKIVKLEGESAKLAGQSIWNFIAEKYGRISVSSVLNLTRIIRNEEKSISNSLGISYTQFLMEYKDFYLSNQIENTEKLPAHEYKIAKSIKNGALYQSEISPDGNWLSYSINKNGKYKVYIKDLSTEKTKLIFRGGIKRMDHKAYVKAPVFNWGDSLTFGVVDYKNGINILNIYNPYTKEWKVRSLRKYEQINYLDIYPNGKTAVISVNVKGQSDLYLISIDKSNSRRLTNDIYDDIYPHFIVDTKKFVFSSNRPNDSTNNIDKKFSTIEKHLNLFLYDIDDFENPIKKITNDLGNNIKPIAIDSTRIVYLSNKSGINNLYQYDLKTELQKQITAYPTGIQQYSINPAAELISFSAYKDQKLSLYLTDFKQDQEAKFLMSTFRKQVELSRQIYLRNTENDNNRNKLSALSESVAISNTEIVDSTSLTSKLDADDFNFESNDFVVKSNQSSLLKNLSQLRKKRSTVGPLDYEPSFEVDNVTVSFLFDPLFGFSPFMDYQMNDLLENNTFSGGLASSVFNQVSGNSNRFYGEYKYLPRLVDYSVRFDRKAYTFRIEEGTVEQKYALNKLQLGFSMPLSTTLRASFQPAIGMRSFVETGSTIFGAGPTGTFAKSPLETEFLYGGSLNLVYDNSEVLGFNIRQGSRAKISFENHNFSSGTDQSFFKFSVDLRHYQKIYKEITFATKLFAGSYFGSNAPYFLLGGLENWATLQRSGNIRTETEANDDISSNPLAVVSTKSAVKNNNILFHDFVTGLRGFRINELNGRKTLLLTNELRIPLFRALSTNAIKSSFLRNFQVIGFYDIGTAWNGGNPWDSDNSINTEIIVRPTFEAVIKNYKNPWLSSTGLGISTVLFGYYGTLYYTIPIEDYKFKDPAILLGIGYNF